MKKLYATFAFAALLTVAGAQSQRLILVEEFTQASCGPCAAANPSFNSLLNANTTKAISLKYQVSWPGVDPMNAQYTNVSSRVSYYNVNSVPYALMDGAPATGGNYSGYPGNLIQADFNNRYGVPSPFDLDVQRTLSADLDSIFITVHATATMACSLAVPRLHTAIIEKHIHFSSPPGSNGETDFYNVVRKVLPNMIGKVLVNSWAVGQDTTFTFAVDIPSYIYDINELAVVCFIQDNGTKEVQQAGYSISPVGVHSPANAFSTVNLFPNPASAKAKITFNLPGNSDVTINIYNTAGMLIRTEKRSMLAGKQEADIDVEMLANGLYLVELSGGEMKLITRLSVMH